MRFISPISARLAAASLALVLASCAWFSPASETPAPAPKPSASADQSVLYEEGLPGGVVVNTVTISAKVTAIDHAARNVDLLRPDGQTVNVKVGPEAVNFDQIEVGDMVNAKLVEQLVIWLGDESEQASDGAAAAVALAPKGGSPGGAIVGTRKVTGSVIAIDHEARTATLRFADGSTQTFPVREDVDLSRRKVGEHVVFQITEMFALDVTKP